MSCRTRFAPSPTGYLHIGGARTALYCWLEARHRGGAVHPAHRGHRPRALAREAAVQAILDGMHWLGLDHDEGPFYQTQRMDRYRAGRRAAGRAPARRTTRTRRKEELEAMREAAMAREREAALQRRATATRKRAAAATIRTACIRFSNPRRRHASRSTTRSRAAIESRNSELDDLVICPLGRLSRPTTSRSSSTTSTCGSPT